MRRASGLGPCGHSVTTLRSSLTQTASTLPEITIAVAPEMRVKGVGGALLDELIVRCTGKYAALTLNVPAGRLYQRKGFRVIGQGRASSVSQCERLPA